jgi:hypothetical protein
MELDYQSPTPRRRFIADVPVLLLQALSAYFALSIITLPFLDSLWIGELPLLALIQLPKIFLAGWLRTDVVMPAIVAAGRSAGSFSPDYGTARPYALASAYLLVLGMVLTPLLAFSRFTPQRWRWLAILVLAAAVDFACTLWLAGGPGLTIY